MTNLCPIETSFIPYPAPLTVDKPYCLSHAFFFTENASQDEEGKSRSDEP